MRGVHRFTVQSAPLRRSVLGGPSGNWVLPDLDVGAAATTSDSEYSGPVHKTLRPLCGRPGRPTIGREEVFMSDIRRLVNRQHPSCDERVLLTRIGPAGTGSASWLAT